MSNARPPGANWFDTRGLPNTIDNWQASLWEVAKLAHEPIKIIAWKRGMSEASVKIFLSHIYSFMREHGVDSKAKLAVWVATHPAPTKLRGRRKA